MLVIIDYDTLIGRLHHEGVIVAGGSIPAATARRLACDADLIPVVLGGDSVGLDLGRSRRLATNDQRRALIARDGPTCAIPDCHIPADHCRAHHLNPFTGGGRTDLALLALLCDRHHHQVHEGDARLHRHHGHWHLEPPAEPPRARSESVSQCDESPPTRQSVQPGNAA